MPDIKIRQKEEKYRTVYLINTVAKILNILANQPSKIQKELYTVAQEQSWITISKLINIIYLINKEQNCIRVAAGKKHDKM